MTTFARKSSSSIASHGKGVLRKPVSSPAAAAVLNEVHELVKQVELRQHGSDALKEQASNGTKNEVNEELVVDIRSTIDDSLSPTSSMHPRVAADELATSTMAVASLWGTCGVRTPISDGPVYSALHQELAKARLDDTASGNRSPSSPMSDSSPRSLYGRIPAGAQEKKLQDSLEEAKTSNRLLSRALSAVQHRLKQAEGEREQLRRERDYFRNLALRFPFTLSVGGHDVYGGARRQGMER
jgi:hypothetical protein